MTDRFKTGYWPSRRHPLQHNRIVSMAPLGLDGSGEYQNKPAADAYALQFTFRNGQSVLPGSPMLRLLELTTFFSET